MTQKERFEKAMGMIDARRQQALQDCRRHREQAVREIPEIGRLQQEMSKVSIRLSKVILAKEGNASEVLPKIMEENLRMQDRIRELLRENGYPEDYLTPRFTCKDCEDTGFRDGRRCHCLENAIKKVAVEEFNHSTTMSLCTFSDFKLQYYSTQNRNSNGLSDFETMSMILKFCQDYAASFSLSSPSILMLGETGLGKTHLSLSIANQVLEKGFTVLYGSAQDYFFKMQNEFFGKGKPGEDVLSTILAADLFILDDLGAEFESSFNASAFYNIVNSRLNQGKPTIINTNLTVREIESRYSNRVLSRLMSLYKTLKFVGSDIRQIKANLL